MISWKKMLLVFHHIKKKEKKIAQKGIFDYYV